MQPGRSFAYIQLFMELITYASLLSNMLSLGHLTQTKPTLINVLPELVGYTCWVNSHCFI